MAFSVCSRFFASSKMMLWNALPVNLRLAPDTPARYSCARRSLGEASAIRGQADNLTGLGEGE